MAKFSLPNVSSTRFVTGMLMVLIASTFYVACSSKSTGGTTPPVDAALDAPYSGL